MEHDKPKSKPKKSQRQVYEYNPFNIETSPRFKKRISKTEDLKVVGEDDIVVSPIAGFWHATEVDPEQFVKLYINGVKALKELTTHGVRVFEMLYMSLKDNMNKDVFVINYAKIDQSVYDINKTSFYLGINELIDKGFIAQSDIPTMYWVNPNYLWNGNRIAYINEFYKKGEHNA